jgi:hypothetical protein
MTDPLTKIDKLAKTSRMERAPSVDVSDQVVASIRGHKTAYGYTPLEWIAVGSIVAAIAMSLSIVSLYETYETWSSPLNTVLLDLFWGLL